ncbi:hypothetical protein D3C85_1625190 [compost metagenome]
MGTGDSDTRVIGTDHERLFKIVLHIEKRLAITQMYLALIAKTEIDKAGALIELHLALIRQQHLSTNFLRHEVANTARQHAR